MRNTIRWDRTSPITVTDLDKTCSALPAQWEGRTAHGDTIYFRYRGGFFSIALWADDDGAGWTDIYADQCGDFLDGYMTFDELRATTPDWITLPEQEWTSEALAGEGSDA